MDNQNLTKPDIIDPVDQQMALEVVMSPNITDDMLAKKMGLSRQTVNKKRNSPEVLFAVDELYEAPRKQIRNVFEKSLACLQELLENEDPKVRLAAALHISKMAWGVSEKNRRDDEFLRSMVF